MLNNALAFAAGALLLCLVLRTRVKVLSSQLSSSEAFSRLTVEADAKQAEAMNTKLANIAGATADFGKRKKSGRGKAESADFGARRLKTTFEASTTDTLSNNNKAFLDLPDDETARVFEQRPKDEDY